MTHEAMSSRLPFDVTIRFTCLSFDKEHEIYDAEAQQMKAKAIMPHNRAIKGKQ